MNQKVQKQVRKLAALLAFSMSAASLPAGKSDLTIFAKETDTYTVSSPTDMTSARFWLEDDGTPMYSISYGEKEVVEESALGFSLQTENSDTPVDYNSGFTLTGTKTTEQDTVWENPFGDRKTVPDKYKELTLNYETKDGLPVDVICRAYDEGVAFRYSFPQNDTLSHFIIKQELTYFNLDNTATAYVHQNRNQTEVIKTPVTELAAVTNGYFRPLTVIGDEYAMSVTEANQIDYTRVHFTVDEGSEPGTLRTIFNGTTDNVDLNTDHQTDDVTVDISTEAFQTSWRTFILGKNEGEVVDHNYLVKNLNPACALDDISWITPGMSIRSSLTTERAKAAIDFASKHGYEYVHFDAGWYGPEGKMESDPWKCIDGFDLDEISTYADANNIRLMVYINYRHLEDQYTQGKLDEMFQMYVNEWGIDGIKFGFVPVGSQASTKMVYEWVKIAAKNHLIVDIHDEMLPTGYDRTYPNLLTYEAVHGDEENPLPKDDLGYLFTRMTAGQADHTWCFNRGDRNTTKAFRFAGSLVYFSPMIFPYWYDDGSLANMNDGKINMDGTKLWDDMPTTWDESHMLESKIEEYAAVARRSGSDWYIAGISASDYALSIPLTMLADGTKYKAEIYTNLSTDSKRVSLQTCIMGSTDVLNASLKSNYGYAVKLSPATDQEAADLPSYAEAMDASAQLRDRIAALPAVTALNMAEIKAEASSIRSAYEQFNEMQKTGVSNIYLLEQAEASVKRFETAPVKTIAINGKTLENFDPTVNTYDISLLGGAALPQISCEPYAESQIVEINQPQTIPGSASVTVKNPFVTKTYTVNFTIPDTNAEIYASDYTDYTADGRKEFKKDTDRSGGALILYNNSGEQETFTKGIGTHAATNIFFQVEGKGISRFQAKCGVSANNGNESNVLGFKVYKNERNTNNLLFDSGDMKQKDPYKEIDVDVTGASVIILEANVGSDGKNSNDHANWCDAKFILGEVFTTPIDEMVQKAETLLSSLTDDTQKVSLQQAISTARAAKETEPLTYTVVYAAAAALRDTIADIRQTEHTDFLKLIDTCKEKEPDGYDLKSWETFLSALNSAQIILQNLDASAEEIAAAKQSLQTAEANLKKQAVLTISCQGFTYDGIKKAQPEVVSNTGDGTVTYKFFRNAACTDEITVPETGLTNAGSYFVTGYAAETEQYGAAVSAPVAFTIEKATPEYTVPSGLSCTVGSKLSSIRLPEGFSFQDDTNTVFHTAGTETVKLIFTPLDEENYHVVRNIEASVTVTESKQQPVLSISCQGFTYDGTKKAQPEIVSNTGDGAVTYKFFRNAACTDEVAVPETGLTNAGSYFVIGYAAETELYAAAVSAPVAFTIEKAMPTYTVPSGLSCPAGSKLSSIRLPKGFSFQDNTETVLNAAGTHNLKLTFTPDNTENYSIVKDIIITVRVTEAAKPLPKVNSAHSDQTLNYIITASSNTAKTVMVTGPSKKTVTSVIIPDSVWIQNHEYKVTEIKNNAFKNCKKLKKAVIGKNIQTIGKNAFSGAKKLKSIKITSLDLKTVKGNAFKNIHKSAKIKTPASKRAAYKRLLKKKVKPSSVKIK